MSLVERFTHGLFWSLLGTVGARFFALITAVVTARLLGKGGFGELGMIQSTIGLLGIFAGFGLGLTTTKYVAELKGKDPVRAGRIIALSNLGAAISGGLMTLTCVLAASWLAQKTLNAPHLSFILQVGSPLLFFSALAGLQLGTLAGFQAFRAIARINFYQGLLALPITLALVYSLGLLGAVLALSVLAMAAVVMSSWALKGECAAAGIQVLYRGSWAERGVLWGFSLPAALSASLISLVTWAGNAVLANQPHGYDELGLFNAANQVRMLIMFLPNIIGVVTVPLLSEIHGQNNLAHFAQVVNANLRTIWSLSLPLGFLLIGLSSWLMAIYGPQFQGGRLVLSLMVCATILYVAGSTIGQSLVGSGQMWVGFYLNLGWAVVLLPLAAYLAATMGAVGLALAYFIAYAFLSIWLLAYTRIKFGPTGVQYSPVLAFLTAVIFLLAVSIEYLPEVFVMTIALCFGLASAWAAWRLLPREGRHKLVELASFYLSFPQRTG